MSDFLKDFEKVAPNDSDVKKPESEKPERESGNMTFQDMKDYFEGMKENLISEMKAEIEKYNKTTPEENTGGNEKEEN